MAAPSASWNTVPVHGTWRNLDGSMKAGYYEVAFPVRVTNATDDVIVPKGLLKRDALPNGGLLQTSATTSPSLAFDCPASDDPDNSPLGWQPTITVYFDDGSTTERYTIDVPLALADDGINLRQVVLPQTLPTPQPVLIRGVPGGLAELDDDGDVVDAAGTKVPNIGHAIVVVIHGNNPNVARPAGAAVVAWCGDAEPVHAIGPDLGGYDFRIPQTP